MKYRHISKETALKLRALKVECNIPGLMANDQGVSMYLVLSTFQKLDRNLNFQGQTGFNFLFFTNPRYVQLWNTLHIFGAVPLQQLLNFWIPSNVEQSD